MVHNAYRYRGGEEQAVENDQALLESRGHQVGVYMRGFDDLARVGRANAAIQALWSARTYLEVRRLVRAQRPDVVHVHNIFPLISTSVYSAAHAEGVPVVQTLHNYRLVCPASTLLRDGRPCELCVGRAPWRSVRYRCYRDSRAQSFALSSILTLHRVIGTWNRQVDAYIALTKFGREIFVRGGLPADRIFVRHNAITTPASSVRERSGGAVYLGRLSPEKGVRVLLEAWRSLPDVPLEIIGDGPLRDEVAAAIAAPELAHVRLVGPLPHDAALARLQRAGMLVFPSICYEGFAFAIVEALACGLPVVASRLGAQAEVVNHGVSGLLFTAGDPNSLRDTVRRLASSPDLRDRLSDGARHEFHDRFSPDASYGVLMDIYGRVIDRKH
jgi:glycosyltransferase involved in cell wall biosynthesis